MRPVQRGLLTNTIDWKVGSAFNPVHTELLGLF